MIHPRQTYRRHAGLGDVINSVDLTKNDSGLWQTTDSSVDTINIGQNQQGYFATADSGTDYPNYNAPVFPPAAPPVRATGSASPSGGTGTGFAAADAAVTKFLKDNSTTVMLTAAVLIGFAALQGFSANRGRRR